MARRDRERGWGGYGPPHYGDQRTFGGYGSDVPGYDSPEECHPEHGEHRGPYAGVGPRGYRRADARIHEDLADHLTEDPELDASDIEVSVRDGEVTLRGSVSDRRARRRAGALADGVRGVRDIHNELRVRPEAATA